MKSYVARVLFVACIVLGGITASAIPIAVDGLEDWSGNGQPYTDILYASVDEIGDDFVFTMALNGAVPHAPATYVCYGFEVFLDAGSRKLTVGAGCTDCQKGVWNPTVDEYSVENTLLQSRGLPTSAMYISYNIVQFVVPSHLLGDPTEFMWRATTHYDTGTGDAPDDAPNRVMLLWRAQ